MRRPSWKTIINFPDRIPIATSSVIVVAMEVILSRYQCEMDVQHERRGGQSAEQVRLI